MPIPAPFRRPRRQSQPRTAFVLSGGASLGAIQAGMMRALYEREIFPDLVVATSAARCSSHGGVVNSTPISHAAALGAERVYVLATDDAWERGLSQPPRAALDAAVHAFRLLSNARLQADLERYAAELELIVLPPANPSHVQPTDFTHARELLDAAYQAVSRMLDDQRVLPSIGDNDDSLIDDDRADARWLGRLSERWPPTRAIPRGRRAVAGAALPEQDHGRPRLSATPVDAATPLSDRSHPPG
jgi:predicted acylesterase/phospholipase RssA